MLDSQEDVNQKLEKHWTLLSIEKESDELSSTIKFVLGWTHQEDEKTYQTGFEKYGF